MEEDSKFKIDLAREILLALRNIYAKCVQEHPTQPVTDIIGATGIGVYAALTGGGPFSLYCEVAKVLCETIMISHNIDHEEKEKLEAKARYN